MTFILILFAICITLLTANSILTHRKLAKMKDELDCERAFRRDLEEIYMRLHEDYKEHMYKYH